MTQTWSPSGYAHHAAFVPALGAGILEKLAPGAGERILDLGCGDGALTERLIERGARVVGVDASVDMIAAARARGIDARVMDATALTFEAAFDAVFSNAVLHWIHDQDAVLTGVARALVPGGRFVAEFGGYTNIAAISVALRAVLGHRQIPYTRHWYYPTPAAYSALLERHGFTVELATLFPRPTPLPTGMAGWLHTFGHGALGAVPEGQRAAVEQEIIELLRPSLCDEAGNWTADYVRLQVIARKPVTRLTPGSEGVRTRD
jgi:trans-aconitate methyltransferase